MSDGRIPVSLAIQPWYQDHCFGGKAVFPAVETMLLLASQAAGLYPDIDIRGMEDVRFAKFLEIPARTTTVPVLIECAVNADGRVRARLLSRVRFKTVSRIIEHGEILFSLVGIDSQPAPDIDPAPLSGPVTEVNVEQLYRELVPFGPNYQTLQETLYLSEHGAWGKLKAPQLPPLDSVQEIIGSPFPLDGAFHAACVLGQQMVDFVPFPVGFDRRTIFCPTQPGSCYITRVIAVSKTNDELTFDLGIFDNGGQVYEMVTGVRMRDVSKGIGK